MLYFLEQWVEEEGGNFCTPSLAEIQKIFLPSEDFRFWPWHTLSVVQMKQGGLGKQGEKRNSINSHRHVNHKFEELSARPWISA